MHVKVKTVLTLALAVHSANASSLFGWVFGSSTEVAAPEQPTRPAEEGSTIITTANSLAPLEAPANVPSPKVNLHEREEQEVPSVEALQEEKTEEPSADRTPTEQGSESSLLGYLNPLNLFSWVTGGSPTPQQTTGISPEPVISDEAGESPTEATPSLVEEKQDCPSDELSASQLGSSDLQDSTIFESTAPDANFRKALGSLYERAASVREPRQNEKYAVSLEESHLVKSDEWEQSITDSTASDSAPQDLSPEAEEEYTAAELGVVPGAFDALQEEEGVDLRDAFDRLFLSQGEEEQPSDDEATYSEPFSSEEEEPIIPSVMQEPEEGIPALVSDPSESYSEPEEDEYEESPPPLEPVTPLNSDDEDENVTVEGLIFQTQQMLLSDLVVPDETASGFGNPPSPQASQDDDGDDDGADNGADDGADAAVAALSEAVDQFAEYAQSLTAQAQDDDLEGPKDEEALPDDTEGENGLPSPALDEPSQGEGERPTCGSGRSKKNKRGGRKSKKNRRRRRF